MRHFTCGDHGAPAIREAGVVVPARQLFLGVTVSWWTDLDTADADALGLGRYLSKCDRTEFCFQATDTRDIVPWGQWWPGRVDPEKVALLETVDGEQQRATEHWFISTITIPVKERT